MGTSYFDAHSLWQRFQLPRFEPLKNHIITDVCIIGGGIAGLTTAYNLAREGVKVIVLDQENLGMGETGLTSAHLTSALDERIFNLIHVHGLNRLEEKTLIVPILREHVF